MGVGIFADCWFVGCDLEIAMRNSLGWVNAEFSVSVSPLAAPGAGLLGLRPQAACGVLALRVPIPYTSQGSASPTPAALRLAPPRRGRAAQRHAQERPCRCGLRPICFSAGLWPAWGARRAANSRPDDIASSPHSLEFVAIPSQC